MFKSITYLPDTVAGVEILIKENKELREELSCLRKTKNDAKNKMNNLKYW